MRLLPLLRSLVFGTIFVALFTWFFPRWMTNVSVPDVAPSVHAIALMLIGGVVMFVCVFQFGWSGRGTPMPLDPPRRLVIRGPYRYVRNPMYLGMALFMIGEAFFVPQWTRALLTLLAVAAVAIIALVLFYEEPTLRTTFGEDYANYCRHVRRWLPRLTPFDKASGAAVPSPHLD